MAEASSGGAAAEDAASRRVEVALIETGGLPMSLTYALPSGLASAAAPGTCVRVPLGSRRAIGIVLGPAGPEPPRGLRDVLAVVPESQVPGELLDLARWAARYYQAPLGALLRAALPPALRNAARRRVRPIASIADAPGGLPSDAASAPPPRAGAGAPRAGTLAARILDRLSPLGVDLEQLRHEFGAGAIAAVRRLSQGGLVAIDQVAVERRAPALALRPADRPPPEEALARAPKKRAVLAYVRGRAPHAVDAAEIEARLPGGRRLAQRLLQGGWLERASGDEAPPSPSPDHASPPASEAPTGAPAEIELHAPQAEALAAIDAAAGRFAPLLLFGVTGSGKTEVYLRAAARALARGAGVLLLVPEIGLTHQLVVQAARRFAGRVAVLHSGLSERERVAAWHDLASGRKTVAIGARSALFAPLRRLGLIVVDEEHDAAYKQEESPRYNARDLAVMRAKLAGCPVVLASATPSLESYQAASSGRYRLVELPARANRAAMPSVELVDLRAERGPDDGAGARAGQRPGAAPEESADGERRRPPRVLLSAALEQALLETYRAGDQSVLFLNRRGFERFLQCDACGAVETCRDCSVSLTVHRARRAAVCHHCGHSRRPATTCRECGSPIEAKSFGTEQVEAAARRLLPAARIARLDRDTGSHPAFVRRTLAAWRAGELDVLVGTQMVAKGHDAPGVTLIGVVLADASLNFPDFRAAERTFQLIAQVAGRAGRGSRPGRVIVQTRQPEHASLVAASRHDFPAFAASELRLRRELGYPPFGRLARIVLEGDAGPTERRAALLGDRLRAAAARDADDPSALSVLGPAPAAIEKLRGRFRHQLLVKARDSRAMGRLLAAAGLAPGASAGTSARERVRVLVDVDPISML